MALPIDAPFKPNLLNSGVYLVSLIMQISTFAINYQGLPFRESIFQNKSMINSLAIVFCVAFAAASEIVPELNSTMELVSFPDEFRYKLLATMALDFGLAWIIEFFCWFFFSNNKAKSSLFPKD
jgi:manganese-transporting P-type ATPase